MSRHLLNSLVLLPCIVESIRISSTFEDRLHVEALSSQGERERATNVAGLPFFSGDNVEARTRYKASQLEFARRAEFSEFFSTITHTAEKADLDGDYFSNRRKSTVSVHKDEKGVHHTWLTMATDCTTLTPDDPLDMIRSRAAGCPRDCKNANKNSVLCLPNIGYSRGQPIGLWLTRFDGTLRTESSQRIGTTMAEYAVPEACVRLAIAKVLNQVLRRSSPDDPGEITDYTLIEGAMDALWSARAVPKRRCRAKHWSDRGEAYDRCFSAGGKLDWVCWTFTVRVETVLANPSAFHTPEELDDQCTSEAARAVLDDGTFIPALVHSESGYEFEKPTTGFVLRDRSHSRQEDTPNATSGDMSWRQEEDEQMESLLSEEGLHTLFSWHEQLIEKRRSASVLSENEMKQLEALNKFLQGKTDPMEAHLDDQSVFSSSSSLDRVGRLNGLGKSFKL